MNRLSPSTADAQSEDFLRVLMRRQLRLSVICALAFLGVLLGLPLANYLWPEQMATRLFGGFTLTWFLLGIGFFPAVWAISYFFIRHSLALEMEMTAAAEVPETPPGARVTAPLDGN